jgi:hypothetical protein
MSELREAREITERLRPKGVERQTIRPEAEARRTLRYGRARILLAKLERLGYILDGDRAAALGLEADLERLRIRKGHLSR